MREPIKFPIVPQKTTGHKENLSKKIKYPEKGIIISEGIGIQALSKAIKITIPGYPKLEIIFTIKELTVVNNS